MRAWDEQPSGAPWCSVLSDGCRPAERPDQPEYFPDLHLDQVVRAIVEGFDAYRLEPFFHCALTDVASVTYRQAVFADLQDPGVLYSVQTFCQRMRLVRQHLLCSERVRSYTYPKEGWFLLAASTYCAAVTGLADDLGEANLASAGLQGLCDWLRKYVADPSFAGLRMSATSVDNALQSIEFMVRVNGGRVTVRRHEDRPDYGRQVLDTFTTFRQSDVDDEQVPSAEQREVNHVEAAVVDLVARLHPEPFRALDDFYRARQGFLDTTVLSFEREVHFYLAYLDHMARLEAGGLVFCHPEVSDRSKQIFCDDTFDIALATSLVARSAPVVTNELHLHGPERVFVVSGPNQGGKTTFARTFGQLHHLACIGCPVPGTRARLYLCDRVFTHFEREEEPGNLTGKLEDDLLRIRDILLQATPSSVVVINEIFTSTTLDDARFLSERVMERLVQLDVLGVIVSFIDELATFGPTTVSMVSTVDPADPAHRTFKVMRRPPNGLAYAAALAQRHGLTYDELRSAVTGR